MSTTPPIAIADHAVIGDLHTVALVGMDATIDFMCMPRLDGPSVFASLLDADGGRFAIEPEMAAPRLSQLYLPDTNVVVTRMLDGERICEVTDFMVVGQSVHDPVLVRIVRSLRGTLRVRVRCAPRFDYARATHATSPVSNGVAFEPEGELTALRLVSDVPIDIDGAAAVADFALAPGEARAFVLGVLGDGIPRTADAVAPYVARVLEETTAFWHSWCRRSTYAGRWRELVMRSALTLKLMVSQDHGSIAAAATFGLPEAPGGERNWDYRFSWIRDASFAVYAFIRLGYVDEAVAFMGWVGATLSARGTPDPLPPLYRLDGSDDLEEQTLEHFAGYGGARPVRIGNGASGQLQLDVYGALMDTVYLTSKYGGAMSYDAWTAVSKHVEWVCKHWRDADEGIWESRNGRKPYLHSRVMCWMAVDRVIRLAEKRSLPAPMERWNTVRNDIHHSIYADFWNDDLQSFVRAKGSTEVDGSTLMLPLVRFIGAKDPRWASTQKRIESELIDDALVYRYRLGEGIDGMTGDEGAFTTCSFWFAECLARQGDVARAQAVFAKAAGFGNHVGLFAEELGPDGTQRGNFPQTLVHLALISAATAIDRRPALGENRGRRQRGRAEGARALPPLHRLRRQGQGGWLAGLASQQSRQSPGRAHEDRHRAGRVRSFRRVRLAGGRPRRPARSLPEHLRRPHGPRRHRQADAPFRKRHREIPHRPAKCRGGPR